MSHLQSYLVLAFCLLHVAFAGYSVQQVFRDKNCKENSQYYFVLLDTCFNKILQEVKGDEIISSYYDTDTTCSSTPFSVTNYTIGKCVQYNDGNNNNAYMYSVVDSISIPYSSSSYQVVSYNGTGCGKYDTIFSLSVFGPNFCNANVGGSSSSYLKCDQTSFYTKNYLTIDCTSVIHDTESAAFSCNDYGSSFLENSCFIPGTTPF